MNVRKPNYPLGFVVLLAALAFLVYSTLPAFFLQVDSRRTAGTITNLTDHSLAYRYRNAFDGETYTVSRYVSVPVYRALQHKRQLTVWCPRYFPEAALVEEVDPHPLLVLPALLGLFLFWALWQIVKRLQTPAPNPPS
jgi:hypothetical protein